MISSFLQNNEDMNLMMSSGSGEDMGTGESYSYTWSSTGSGEEDREKTGARRAEEDEQVVAAAPVE